VSNAEIAERLKAESPDLATALERIVRSAGPRARSASPDEFLARLIDEARTALDTEKAELALVLATPDDEAVLVLDAMGIITGVCKLSAEILGREQANLLGVPVDVLLSGRSRGVEQSSDEMARAEHGERVHATRTHVRDDGTTFEAEHTVVALIGRRGEVSGFARRIHDLTERRLHEVHVEELNASVALLIRSRPDRV